MSVALSVVPDPADEEAASPTPVYDFDKGFQRKIVALTLRDGKFCLHGDGLIKPGYLEDSLDAALVDIGQRYFEKYRVPPTTTALLALIKDAVKDKRLRPDLAAEVKPRLLEVLKLDLSDREFVLDKVAEFARNRAVEDALCAGVELLRRGDFARIEKLMQDAVNVGKFEDDGGVAYYETIEARTHQRKEKAAGTLKMTGIPTGYTEINNNLYHNGWGRKELSLLMGGAKAGKSLGLWDFGKNATLELKPGEERGYNVLGLTCEVATKIIMDRCDANIAEHAMRTLHEHPYDVEAKIKAASAKAGRFDIHEYASGTLKPSMVRRLLERYRSRGIIYDLVVIDYLDIMTPDNVTDSAVENSKAIYLGSRALAFEFDLAVLSATQTNRDGAKATTAKATDVAEDFNRIRIADVVIGINASDDEKKINEARLYWAASRNTEDGFTIRIRQDREKMKFIKRILGRE